MSLKLSKPSSGRQIFSTKIAAVTVWTITILWTIPTFGLLVTSFRNGDDIYASGWWSAFTSPSFTLQNYRDVFFGGASESLSDGILPYFVNSIVITLPATIFPIVIATMAAFLATSSLL